MSDQIGFWTGGSFKTMERAPTIGFGHTPYHVKDARAAAGYNKLLKAKSVYKCKECGFEGETRGALKTHERLHAELYRKNRVKITKKTLTNRVFEGRLWKRGGIRKNWKRRYFRLGANARAQDGSFLFAYYIDQPSSRVRRPLGVVDLRGAVCRASRRRVHKNKFIDAPTMFHFEIVTPNRTYELASEDARTGRDWINTIKIAIESAPEAYKKVGPARWSKRGSKPLKVVCSVPGCKIQSHNHNN